ncbi:MAG: hypothetical protein ACREV2_12690, partial [Burkholderiales bacterium]
PGVTKVTRNGEFLHVHYSDLDPTQELVRRAVEQSWGLYHLARNTATLEEVFVQLTRESGTENSGIGNRVSGEDTENPIPDSRSPLPASST